MLRSPFRFVSSFRPVSLYLVFTDDRQVQLSAGPPPPRLSRFRSPAGFTFQGPFQDSAFSVSTPVRSPQHLAGLLTQLRSLLPPSSSVSNNPFVSIDGLFMFAKPNVARAGLLAAAASASFRLNVLNEPSCAQVSEAVDDCTGLLAETRSFFTQVDVASLAFAPDSELLAGASCVVASIDEAQVWLAFNDVDPLSSSLAHELLHLQCDREGFPRIQSPFLEHEVDRRVSLMDPYRHDRFVSRWVPALLDVDTSFDMLLELFLGLPDVGRATVTQVAASSTHHARFERFLASPVAEHCFDEPWHPSGMQEALHAYVSW